MGYKLGVLLDPPDTINPLKDTSLAIMIAAQKRDWEVSFFTLEDLRVDNSELYISSLRVELHENAANWHTILQTRTSSSTYFDAILIRRDPPFDMNYVYSTYLLERESTPVFKSAGQHMIATRNFCRNANCCPPHIVSSNKDSLRSFMRITMM